MGISFTPKIKEAFEISVVILAPAIRYSSSEKTRFFEDSTRISKP